MTAVFRYEAVSKIILFLSMIFWGSGAYHKTGRTSRRARRCITMNGCLMKKKNIENPGHVPSPSRGLIEREELLPRSCASSSSSASGGELCFGINHQNLLYPVHTTERDGPSVFDRFSSLPLERVSSTAWRKGLLPRRCNCSKRRKGVLRGRLIRIFTLRTFCF